MRQGSTGTGLRVRRQGNAYAAVIGVTVGMLLAGLVVPLAFGKTPVRTTAGDSNVEIDQGFANGGSPLPGESLQPHESATPGSPSESPSAGPDGEPSDQPSEAASPGEDEPTDPGSGASSTGGPSTPVKRTASDTGITPTTMKIGIVLLDIRALAPLGFSQPHFTPQEQQSAYEVFIDQVNKKGGIAGRRVIPVFKTFNALDSSGSGSAGAICIALAENEKVFAAIGVLGSGNLDTCLTQQYGIPAVSNTSQIAEAFNKAHNKLVSPYATFERGAANLGNLSARSGLLKGRKLGTVSSDIPTEKLPEAALVKALSAEGFSTTYRSHLSSDSSNAQSQMPVEIQKMKSAGVNTVYLLMNFIQAIQFVQAANQRNYRPQYIVSDLGSLTAEGLVRSMPASFDGAYAFTQGLATENAATKNCRETFNRVAHQNYAAGDESGGVTLFCWMVTALDLAGDKAGPNPTRNGVADAFQHLSGDTLPHTLPGTFKPGKTDYSDYFRAERYSTSCKCYRPAGNPQRGRY